MKIILLIYFIKFSESFISNNLNSTLQFNHSKFILSEKFSKLLYKEIRRRIRNNTIQTLEKRNSILQNTNSILDKRNSVLHNRNSVVHNRNSVVLENPKTNYEIYISVQEKPIEIIKNQFLSILNKLKRIGIENIHIYNLGLKTLIKPIKKQSKAIFLLIKFSCYPSLINLLRLKLLEEQGVLRILLLKDKKSHIYRDNNYYIRHYYFNKLPYNNFLYKLKTSPYI